MLAVYAKGGHLSGGYGYLAFRYALAGLESCGC